jgi:6-phosphogluconolactonase
MAVAERRMIYATPALEVAENAEAVAQRAADWLAERLQEARMLRGHATLAVSGGGTAPRALALLAARDRSWENVDVFQVDERVAPGGHPDRNAVAQRAAFARKLQHHPERIHWMPVEEAELDAAAAAYERELAAHAGAPPVLDVVHLGIGEDGHTASLFPASPQLDAATLIAGTGEHHGRRRMTMTLPLINRARQILWIVTGIKKRSVLARLLRGDPALVASRVRRTAALILADVEAAPRDLL